MWPYEIFCGHLNGLNFKFQQKRGKIIKVKSGHYKLEIGDDIDVENFSEQFTPTEKGLFRMVSASLRHRIPIKFIVEQLQKSEDDITSMSNAAARVLKKYINDGENVIGLTCQSCKSTGELVYEEGCIKCLNCGWSRCN
jgi:ribonucleoside-diphosphate reductase alpha chain